MSKEIEAVKTEDLPDPFLEENSIKVEEEEKKKKKRKKSPSDDAGQDEAEKPQSKSKPRVKLCKLNSTNNRYQIYSFKKCYS